MVCGHCLVQYRRSLVIKKTQNLYTWKRWPAALKNLFSYQTKFIFISIVKPKLMRCLMLQTAMITTRIYRQVWVSLPILSCSSGNVLGKACWRRARPVQRYRQPPLTMKINDKWVYRAQIKREHYDVLSRGWIHWRMSKHHVLNVALL